MSQHPFDLLMELPDEEIRLDCAALHFARDAYPHLDLPAYLGRLDALADEVAAMRAGLAAPLRYQALREVLVEEHGFRGNQDDYYHPDNSYLNCVLDSGRGIPITLAMIWIEVGRRLNWPVAGVALPGHFLVRLDDPERFVAVDVFNDGCSLGLDDCERIVEQRFEGKMKFTPEFLEPVDTRAVLTRSLGNLRHVFSVRQDWPRLGDVLRRLAALEPENSAHLGALADVCSRQGDLRGAYAHLAACLERLPPEADERTLVQREMQRLEWAILRLN